MYLNKNLDNEAIPKKNCLATFEAPFFVYLIFFLYYFLVYVPFNCFLNNLDMEAIQIHLSKQTLTVARQHV